MKIPVQAIVLATIVALVVLIIGPLVVEADTTKPPAGPGAPPAPGGPPAPAGGEGDAGGETTKKSAAVGLRQPSLIQLLILNAPFLVLLSFNQA
nr:unnamed protein product [Callosobruchus chinensis]